MLRGKQVEVQLTSTTPPARPGFLLGPEEALETLLHTNRGESYQGPVLSLQVWGGPESLHF